MTVNKRILLIYPGMGMLGTLVCHMPLSLIYAATDSIKAGFAIDLVDIRINPDSWEQDISAKLSPDTILVGISVMSGAPIYSALKISRWLKSRFPAISIVWGGPHALFNAADILKEPSIDYAISGYGSLALAQLAQLIRDNQDTLPLTSISGLTFRNKLSNEIEQVPAGSRHEIIDYRDIDYSLIEKDLHLYGQLDSGEVIFPMYSTIGCPYRCAFCSSPAQYNELQARYEQLPPSTVVDHIEMVCKKFNATYIYFIDDDSFVNLSHVDAIIDEIKRRDLNIRLGFRGAHIIDIQKMDDAYINKLADNNINILHIGAESGSQRMLDAMKKNTTVEDIIEANRKLAGHPRITAMYNWLYGLPGETLDDLRQTRELILQLLQENPSAIIYPPNKYRPLPGTELYETALTYGYRKPDSLEDWIDIEAEGDYRSPWYSKEYEKMLNMMFVTSYFIDRKLTKLAVGNSLKYLAIKWLAKLYTPLAIFRFRKGLTTFLVEYRIFNYVTQHYKW